MRYLLASLMLCCAFVNGYAQDEEASASVEVTANDDGACADATASVENQ